MDEYLDILDEKGNKTGEALPYDETHRRGLLHRSVHVWFINSKSQLLLQKRSQNKRAYPSYWDVSVAGHISSGETSVEAAQKETREEIGLELPELAFELLSVVKQPRVVHREDFIDDEFNDVYIVHQDLNVEDLKLPPDEVEEVRWISIEEFKKWIKGEGELLVPHEEEYQQLLSYLKLPT